jgi:hypothetical protein
MDAEDLQAGERPAISSFRKLVAILLAIGV